MPMVRAPRRDGVPLRRRGARRLSSRSAIAYRRAMGTVRVLPGQSQGPVRRTVEPSRRVPPLVQRNSCHSHLPIPRRVPPRRAEAEPLVTAPFRTAGGGRIDRTITLDFTFGGKELTGHAGDTLASALLANGI